MPSHIYKTTNSSLTFIWWTEPTARDNSGSHTLSSSHKPGDAFPIGLTEVTYTAEDPSGNRVTEKFTVHLHGKYAKHIVVLGKIREIIHYKLAHVRHCTVLLVIQLVEVSCSRNTIFEPTHLNGAIPASRL